MISSVARWGRADNKPIATHIKTSRQEIELKVLVTGATAGFGAAIAASLVEAGDKLFTFTRFPKSQWKSIRTSNAIERLHEEFKRRIKTQTLLPSAETAAMLFWALLASGQITMRKVDGWQTFTEKPSDPAIDLDGLAEAIFPYLTTVEGFKLAAQTFDA